MKVKVFLGAENVIVKFFFCISQKLGSFQWTFYLSRNIYLFSETFIFSVKLSFFQLLHLLLYWQCHRVCWLLLRVNTCSLPNVSTQVYPMSDMPHNCPYCGKNLKYPMFLNVSYTAQIGPFNKNTDAPQSPDYLFTPIYLIFSNPSDSCHYEMFRPPVCSCSVPGECETTEDNVLEVWNLAINIMFILVNGDHMSEWQPTEMALQT